MKKLVVIADWADDTLNCQEFRSTVEGFLKEPDGMNVNFISSTPSTIHAAFMLQQIVEIEERYGRPLDTVIFLNVDTRLQTAEGVEKAKGAELIVMRLKSGLYILGPNAEYDFSLVKDRIDEVYLYPGFDKGSQFRSRDLYGRVSAHLMESLEDEMELEETSSNVIPVLEGRYVGHIDNHGNMKTTLTEEDMKGKYEVGDKLKIRINGVEKEVKYVSNLFGGVPGELVIYPGSSGSLSNLYLEVTIWRHFTEKNPTTGLHEFNHPLPGMKVEMLK